MPIDYSKYPPDWLSHRRPRIMARAGNKCEDCGLKHKSTVYSIKMDVRDTDGRYKTKRIWFRSLQDAERELRYADIKHVRVILTIAHLDHDEENWDVEDDRLRALCQKCHLMMDAKEKYRRLMEKWKKSDK